MNKKIEIKQTDICCIEILLLRDGVCEGQFSKVLQVELLAIREACVKVGPSNNFKETFARSQFLFCSLNLTTCQGSR